jgi:HEAT repeat protein
LDGLVEEMNDSDEKVRSTAAVALGGVVAGSVQKYFPPLLEYLQRTTQPLERSLILHSIKEVYISLSTIDFRLLHSTRTLPERHC